MAKKNLELAHEGLGDLTDILHNQGVSDLSWLSVSEEEYRASEALPKQNLDMIPELQKALAFEPGDDVPHLIPLRPHTVVNTNPIEGLPAPVRDLSSPIRNRVAKLVMAGRSIKDILDQLKLEFSPSEIRAASQPIRDIVAERGLLGNVYVDASHFPHAAQDPKERRIAQSLSKGAQYVIGGCQGKNGCDCHQTGFCKTFGGKRVVSEVPYGANVAAHYAPLLIAQHRPIERIAAGDVGTVDGWKKRIQTAFLRPIVSTNADGIRSAHQQDKQARPNPTPQDVIDFWNRRFQSSDVERMPSPAYLKYARRMASGSDDRELLTAALEPDLRALASEYGLLGHSWLDMDAVGGCDATYALMGEKGLKPDFVVRRSAKCHKCHGASDGACTAIGRCASIVTSKPAYDKQTFAFALRRAATEGRVTHQQMQVALTKVPASADWAGLTRQANLIQAPEEDHSEYTGAQVSAFYGSRSGDLGKVQVNPEEVRQTISHLMNTGLHGRALKQAILSSYSREDLVQVPQVGRRMASEDGVQGSYFIDPTAYTDYGRGCEEGSKHFRKRGAPNVLASSSCTGCVLQTSPGWCSKYSKDLVRTVPVQVREHVASVKRHLPVVKQVPAVDPSEQFQLSSEIEVDLNGSKSRSIDISIGSPSLDE